MAGIIQGSSPDGVHSQDYRGAIKAAIARGVPGARVYCPFENHPQSLGYRDEKARSVFFDHIEMVAAADCLVAFVPQASMGTAVEMYAAREAGRPVITISPLASNWTVKFLSDKVLATVEDFVSFAESGQLVEFLGEFKARG
jgi:nucleoside 2-deoxyribosyltransferase